MVPSTQDPIRSLSLVASKFRDISETMPIRWIEIFLYVIQRLDSEDLYQERIAEAIGVSQGVASKMLRKMSTKKGGLGLFDLELDLSDERKKTITLTVKGKKLVADIQNILG